MDIFLIIYLVGSALILLSWVGLVPARVGWSAFILSSASSLLSYQGAPLSPFWWLWLVGAAIMLGAWVFRWEQSTFWIGAFTTFTAAGLDLVASHARALFSEPVVVLTPSLDLLVAFVIGSVISHRWVTATVCDNPEALRVIRYRTRARVLRHALGHRADKKRLAGRIRFLSDIEYKSLSYLSYHILGRHTFAQGFFLCLFIIAMGSNYYATGTTFGFVFFETNWEWAMVLFFLGSIFPSGYLMEKQFEQLSTLPAQSRHP